MTTSVLMSVYQRVNETELTQCLASLTYQTQQPDQIVIVIDGPIPDNLEIQLQQFEANSETKVTLVPLKENGGLTKALNAGLSHCTGEWIFRMDADDISSPDRFEVQLEALNANPHIDLLGTAMWEFSNDPRNPERFKPVKAEHKDIKQSFALRNPINHPTICMRKELIQQVGGYPELPLLEDYFLWAKLLQAGATFHNLTSAHYLFRFDDATLHRRGGAQNFRNEIWLRRWMYRAKLTTLPTYLFGCTIQLVLRFAPMRLQRWLWHRSRQPANTKLDLPASIQP